jgi:hypothetical protein
VTDVLDKSFKESQNPHYVRLLDYVEQYCRAGHATDENMAHAHCMLDTQGYKHTQHMYQCNNGRTNAPKMLRYAYIGCRVII